MKQTTHTINNCIVLATRNPGKMQELKIQLQNIRTNVLDLKTFPKCPEVEETGSTFEENSLLKAKVVSNYTGLIAIADDSGLEVDALHGAPGIFSSRYAEDVFDIAGISQDKKNITKLLKSLIDIPFQNRTAQFRTAIVAYHPNGNYLLVTGTVRGVITFSPQGTYGFGYDPIFFLQEQNKTFAELTTEEKKLYSHRGKALKKLIEKWNIWENTNFSSYIP